MKQRFSSLDVKVIAHELSSSLVTFRLANIYDLSSKIFLFKFAKPDDKKQMIIDSGFRCHLTSFARATAAAPSAFVAKLRKFLKTRRVTSVAQVGTDRIIEFQFSDGQYRLFLEFYAGGNIILTDKELNILTLLRIVPAGEGQEELRIGLKYSLEDRQNYGGIPPLTKDRLQLALQKAADKGEAAAVGKKQKKTSDALRKALAISITEYPPLLVDHAMKVTNFDSTLKPGDVANNDELLDHLLRSLQEAQRVVQEITSSEVTKGYIIAKRRKGDETQASDGDDKNDTSRENLLYEDFHPFRPRQFEEDPSCIFLPFEGFNKTVDEFFSSIEGQRLESRLHERELTAKKKLEAAKQDQQKRLGGLQEVQELNERKAAAIEANIERVQEAMDAVNGLIAQGMDWVEIGKLIEVEQKRRNPVAAIIKLPLKLHENTITLLLDEETFVDDDEDSAYETDNDVSDSEDEAPPKKEPAKKEQDKRLTIDINLGVSPWSNAREYYDQRRSAVDKEMKTLQSSTKALKSTEQKINQDLRKGLKLEKAILRPVRRQMFFEKFIWFISSDGYLVLGGRDAQQNEILYKKYLRKGDVYVHADMHGAASIVIRNNPSTPDAPIPPSTLSQAGTLAVASSSAWDSKAGMGSWWVYADQVSKSAPTGEFLPTGSFMVRGTRNFLPPAQLLLGFGVMFHISDESRSNHSKHRLQSSDTDSGQGKPQAKGDLINSKGMDGSDDENLQNASDDEDDANTQNYKAEDEDLSYKPANPLQSAGNSFADEADQEESSGNDPTTEGISQLSLKGQATEREDVSGYENPNDNKDDANEDAEPQEGQEDADADSSSADTRPSSSTLQPKQKGPAPLPRGKRSKAKKAAAKYKYQDEEDRLAAEELIGSAAGRAKAEEEAKVKAGEEATAAFHKERRKQQHQRTLEETAKHEQARKAMLEAGEVIDDDTTEAEKELVLDTFVGTPLPGDEILDAIPVCAPWAAMGRFKYKVKLQPGAVKKGKAVKEILAKWTADVSPKYVDQQSKDVEKMWPREIELLKGFKVEECVNVVPVGKVRVMMSGGAMGGVASNKGQGKAKGGGKGGKKSR